MYLLPQSAVMKQIEQTLHESRSQKKTFSEDEYGANRSFKAPDHHFKLPKKFVGVVDPLLWARLVHTLVNNLRNDVIDSLSNDSSFGDAERESILTFNKRDPGLPNRVSNLIEAIVVSHPSRNPLLL